MSDPLLTPEEIEEHTCRVVRIQALLTRAERIAKQRHRGLASLLNELHCELGEAADILGFDMSDDGPVVQSGGSGKG